MGRWLCKSFLCLEPVAGPQLKCPLVPGESREVAALSVLVLPGDPDERRVLGGRKAGLLVPPVAGSPAMGLDIGQLWASLKEGDYSQASLQLQHWGLHGNGTVILRIGVP